MLRSEILTAAAAILDETGNEQAASLRAVARRVRIAAPSIYPHFADPQAIMHAVVLDAFASLKDQLTAAVRVAGPDPVDRLEAICTTYLAYTADQPERYRVMFGGLWNASKAVGADAITAPVATEIGQDVLLVLVEALAATASAGRSSSQDPFADAVAIWLAMHGLAHQRAVSRLFPFPADVFERLVRPLLQLTTP